MMTGRQAGVRHLHRRLCWGSSGVSLATATPEGVASLLRVSCPITSSAGENSVHSWVSDGGAFDVVPFLKALLWNSASVEMSPVADALCSLAPGPPLFDGWVCFGCMAIAAGGAGGRGWKSELLFTACLSLTTITPRPPASGSQSHFSWVVSVLLRKPKLLVALQPCSATMTCSSVYSVVSAWVGFAFRGACRQVWLPCT
jgi:hypothetical protein